MVEGRRVLLIGGVATVKGRIKHPGLPMVELCNELEPELRGFAVGAPFSAVSLVIRFGERESACAEIGRIDKNNSELPVAYELPMERLRGASQETLKREFLLATVASLQQVADVYGLELPDSVKGLVEM